MKIATFKDQIFTQKFILTYGKMEEIKKWLSDRKIELDNNTDWQAFSGRLPSGEHHLHFDYYGFTAIVHETHHASLDILNNRGLKCNQETKEVFAYYQDWLAGKCRDYLEKWNKKIN